MSNPELDACRKHLNQKRALYDAAALAHTKDKRQFIQAEDALVETEQAQKLIQHAAQIVQTEAHKHISTVVTRCLALFDDPYTFDIRFERKRGKTEAELCFIRNGMVLDNPLEQAGGGCVEVAAFALRLACIILQRPPLRRLMVLDEPFKCIRGKHNRDRVRDLILSLAHELDMQFILCVDHEAYPQFVQGRVVEVEP